MRPLLETIQNHAGAFLLGLAALFAVDLVFRLFHRARTDEAARRAGGDRLRAELTQNSSEVSVLLRAADGTTAFVSENITAVLGLDAGAVYADRAALLRGFGAGDARAMRSRFTAWAERSTPLSATAQWQLAGRDALRCRVDARLTADGKYILVTLCDVTERYEAEQQLRNEAAQALQSAASKTTFLSNMSHEIRTPLNGMLGMIGLARMNLQDTAAVTDYLEKAENLSQFLLSVINDILDMSRIESGRIQLEAAPFDLRGMVGKLRSMFETTVREKGILFEVEQLDITAPYVVGDELRVTQILTNFLSNASKFTPAGGKITLTVRQMDVLDGKVALMLRVRDTGKGMSPEFLHRIFKPFEQEDAGIARRYGGSGLGMAISDQLVKLMGGQLLVDSELGKGSEFTVFLRLSQAEASQVVTAVPARNTANVRLEGRHLLLAEDHKVNAMIVIKMLAARGITVEHAENGRQALEMFECSAPGEYDAILMDIQMPEMDGWTASRRIRALTRPDAHSIPIFALSADAFVEDKRRSAEAGMNGHVTKPVNYDELCAALKQSLGAAH